MPEGDTIWRTAVALRRRLIGKTVTAAAPDLVKRLEGHRLVAVEPVGKHLIMRFDGQVALHSHMRMTGSWHLYRPGERWRQPERRARAVLNFDGAVAVLFSAPVVEVVRDDRQPVQHLGPDVLAETFDIDEVIRRARLSQARTIGELLLEQRVCAGIGNIYKCETLWTHRVNPWSAPSSLDQAELRGLYLTARDLMRRALTGKGFAPRHAVHGRGGRSCPRCGTRISVRAQGEQARMTFFCPRCQRKKDQPTDWSSLSD